MKKRLDYIKNDEELSQAVARTVVTLIVFVYLLTSWFFTKEFTGASLTVVGCYLFYSLYNLKAVASNPGVYPVRRIVNIIGDISVVSFAMHQSTIIGVVLYPILLWIIVGNGVRFGTRYLFFALATGVVLMTPALWFNRAWNGHEAFIFSLSMGLVVLGFFYARLITRLHKLNENLEQKVEERVQQVEYQYLHDSLTDLKNREALNSDLKQSDFGGLLVVDIDQFHNYNEIYGMQAGNCVLIEVAKLLQNFATEKQYEVYRVYSDHFALRGVGRFPVHLKIEEDIEELFTLVSEHEIFCDTQDEKMKIDITIGISLEKQNALKKAEMALSHAKKKKIPYIAYSKLIDSSSNSQELMIWKNALKSAIIHDNIVPVFQPIVDRSEQVVKYEALMRLRRVKEGKEELVSPFYFLEIAFKSKQYASLTRIMIEKSFRFIQKSGSEVSINLAFEDIINPKTGQILKEKLVKYKIAHLVIFEIVESSDIDDFEKVKDFIDEFRVLGVRIAIDDFGTGYSNFNHIIELSPDFLKIDGSLVKNIDKDRKSYLLVRTIVKMARHLGIKTIAEFVSTEAIYHICYKMGVDYFQGYYFSEPLEEERVRKFETKVVEGLV